MSFTGATGLATTGSDIALPLVIGGVLLLLAIGLIVFAAAKKKRRPVTDVSDAAAADPAGTAGTPDAGAPPQA